VLAGEHPRRERRERQHAEPKPSARRMDLALDDRSSIE